MQSISDQAVQPSKPTRVPIGLIVGDVVAFSLFVIVGRISHGFTDGWLTNVARILTPFLVGWTLASIPAQAYRTKFVSSPSAFLVRSAVALFCGDLIAYGIRAFVFDDTVTLSFAITTIGFTLLFLLSWRGPYVWWQNRSGSQTATHDPDNTASSNSLNA